MRQMDFTRIFVIRLESKEVRNFSYIYILDLCFRFILCPLVKENTGEKFKGNSRTEYQLKL